MIAPVFLSAIRVRSGMKIGGDLSRTLLTFVMLAGMMMVGNMSWGQTNPAPHNLSTSNFSFTGFASGTTTSYPTSIQGHKFSAERTTANLTGTANGDRVLDDNSTLIGTGSIRNEIAGGISLLNSGSNHIGAIVLAVNSTGREALKVTFTALQLNSGGSGATDRINGVRLQYRVGTSGDYSDVASTEYLSTNTASQNAASTFTDVALPTACSNEPIVQLRWVYYISSGSANGRDRISIDDISVTSVPLTPTTTSISPSSATEGGAGFTLTVDGTNFINGVSTVRWNGNNRTTTFVSATQLTATIPLGDIATQGTASVTVLNTGNPSASNAQTFTINAAGSCGVPLVGNTTATSVGVTIATLNAEVTNLGSTATAITDRGMEYASNSSLTSSTASNQTGTFGLGTFSRSLTGLNANAQYWYRGFSTNDCSTPLTGYTHTSGFPTFTTQHNAPTVLPESNVTAGGFTANWAVNNSNSAGGATFTYTLEYSTTSNFSSGVTAVSSIPSGTTSYNVTGLSAGTPYWYRVRISNAGGNSNYSGIEPVVTLNTIATGAVSTSPFCVSATGTTSGTVAFTSVGTFTGNTYSVELSNSSGTFSGTIIGTSNSDANAGTINVTIPANTPTGAGYRMRVLANAPATTGEQSAAFTVNLGPANVTAQTATVGNTQVRVNWTNPTTCFDDIMVVAKPTSTPFTGATPSGTAYTHNSNSFTDPLNTTFDGGKVVYRGSTPMQWITGLTNGTNYTFKIFSRKNDDWSAGVTTTGTPVPPSVNLSINSTTGTEAATSQVILTATAASAVIGDQTVNVAISGTGITNADFTGVTFPTTITILNGATIGSISFNIADDNVSEGSETATFTISSPTSGITIGGTSTRTLTITDNPLTFINLTTVNVAHTENFNGMGTSSSAATPTGFAIQDGNTTTLASSVTQQASAGTPTAGGSYNWGESTSERALGLMFSSGYNAKSIIAAVRNSTGTAGNVFEISFDYEQYRRNTASQTFKLQYSTSMTAGWADVTGGGFDDLTTGSNTYGFSPLIASQSISALQFTPASAVPDGSTVYFRWILDGTTNSNGVGIDNFSIALVTISCSTPTTAATNGTFPTIGQNNLTLDWESGGGDNRVVYVNSTNSFTAPTDGAALPAVNTTWANSGQQLIYNGTGNSASVSNLQAGTTYFFRVYEYNCTNTNTRFQNTATTFSEQTAMPASTASIIQTQNGETTAISSLINGTIVSNSDGVQVWHFRLYDGDGSTNDADGLPTIYTGWTIRAGAGNTVPNWSTAIQDRKFFLGSNNTTPIAGGGLTNPTNILFPVSSPFITVPDNGFVDIYMHITLANPLPAGSDGQHFVFSLVPADVTVASSSTSSQLGTFTATSNAALNEIDIAATLQFINAPSTVGLGDAFTITVSAIDINGNIDQDVTSAINLSQNSGTGTMTGGGTLNLANGTRTWSGLTYDVEETFQVIASGGSYSSITATINVVDAEYQLFDHFNRPDNNTVGVPSSEASVAWNENETGNGSRARIEGGLLMLTNCNSGESTNGSAAMEQVLFNVENRYETVFNNADGQLEWVFNMQQGRFDPSGFGSATYGVATILGSDQLVIHAAGANGYAVVIGNASSGDPKPVKLVKFTNGLTSNANVTNVAISNQTAFNNYYSIKVTYNPCNGLWSLYVRNDGNSAFADPNVGSLGTAVTGTDQTHTGMDLKYFGAVWQHNTSCTEIARFDNLYIPNANTAIANTKTWSGSVSANWNDANNWGPCPGVPTTSDNVVIPNVTPRPVVSATPAAVCRALTVNSGAELTINSGQNLTTDNAVTNNGTIRVMNSGNFIQTANSIAHAGSGNMVVQRQGSASTTVYNYWSSPVVNGILPGGNQYYYDSSLGTHSNTDDTPADLGWQSFSGSMTPGQGYASTGGGLANFTGVANNNDVPFGVTTSAQPMNSLVGGTRFNLVGNPYPSAISANAFINANGPSGTGRIAGVLYFWDDDNSGGSGYATNDYATWTTIGSVGGGGNTPLGSIASGQGFKVDATSDGDVTFTNAMRGGNNTQFFRLTDEDDTMDRLWLSLSGNDLFNQTLVAFRDDATDLRDVMYDAHKIQGNSGIALASVQAGETFAIAAYPTITQPRTVPLQTFVAQQGSYTFEADSLDGFAETDVYLQDLQSGQAYLLVQGSTVTVNLGPQDAFNRFQLWLSPQLVTGLEGADEHSARIISSEMGLQVLMSADINTNGELRLFNAMGQLLLSQHVRVDAGRSSLLDVSALPAGIYVAAFRSSQGVVNAKVVLR
jgi:trimeric autotransporter adhesin